MLEKTKSDPGVLIGVSSLGNLSLRNYIAGHSVHRCFLVIIGGLAGRIAGFCL